MNRRAPRSVYQRKQMTMVSAADAAHSAPEAAFSALPIPLFSILALSGSRLALRPP
jgi:hypothetical protein